MLNIVSTPTGGSLDEQLTQLLQSIRSHLGMEIGLVSEFRDGRRYFRHVDSSSADCPVVVGASDPLEQSYCHLVATGKLPEIIPDTAEIPAAAALPVTRAQSIGAHLSTPVVLSDGTVYGMLCCISHSPERSLNERDLSLIKVFADIAGKLIETDTLADRERATKADRIRQIIEQRQLAIVYQPLYQLADDSLAGFEALSRFSIEPLRSPDKWFAEAAEVNLGTELELLAVREVSAALLSFAPELAMAVNLSPHSIVSPEFSAMFADAPLQRLVLEITEHAIVENYGAMAQTLTPLRQRGLRIAVDDAGAGHSSFRHVLDLKPDVIKLDMSLTRDIDRDPARRALAEALTRFGCEMGSEIVAEGVETRSELEALRRIGVTKAQGYLLGRPMPLKEAVSLAPLLGARPRGRVRGKKKA